MKTAETMEPRARYRSTPRTECPTAHRNSSEQVYDGEKRRQEAGLVSQSSGFQTHKLTRKFPLLLIGSRRLAARFSSSDPQLCRT